jgi:DNA-binding LacI/PurR family transcriptional regulator
MQFKSLDFNSSKSLYLQITNIIEDKIRNKEIAVGRKLPPQNELRKTFNVSIDTMREAISNLVDEGYLSCRPTHGTVVISSEPKKGISLERRNGICLVYCPFGADKSVREKTNQDACINRIVNGAEEKAREEGKYLLYTAIDKDELNLFGKEKEISGLIVTGFVSPEYYRVIKKTKIPFILIGDIAQKARTKGAVDVVVNNDFEGTYLAAKHLIELGHKKILYLARSFGQYPWNNEMLRGYKEALENAGIEYDEHLSVETKTKDAAGIYKVVKGILDNSVSFTAIVYVYDYLGFEIVRTLAEKGMNIPEDISIVGIGGIPELAVVDDDYRGMGRTAVERLIERVKNPDIEPKRIVVPPYLIVRDSVRKLI